MCYAVWTGIGILGTMVLGVFLFGESFDIAKVVCMLLILSGIVGFKLISA
jgi:quaternary ammonium compound-resistance protein SugE